MKFLVDSDALIALFKNDDANHKKAKTIFLDNHKKGSLLCLSNLIFTEVTTVLSQRVSKVAAVNFINLINKLSADLHLHFIDEELHELATKIFIQEKSKNTSFVDCSNIALIKNQQLDGVFGFDGVYKKYGIARLE